MNKRLSFEEIVNITKKISEEDRPTVALLGTIAETRPDIYAELISKLQHLGITGHQILRVYRDHCESNLNTFITSVLQEDPTMLATIRRSSR